MNQQILQSINSKQILRVAVPSPVKNLFDYLIPTTVSYAPCSGARVLVPFGKRNLTGIIIEVVDHSTLPAHQLKAAFDILDPEPIFAKELIELFIWASNYYQYPLGMLFDAALPAWLRKLKSIDFIALPAAAKNILPRPQLNQHQHAAVDAVKQSFHNFQAFLLDGITGSGKTEVYMQLIEHALKMQLQTLILVPEINLTPQTLQKFEQRFHVPIAVLHSQISEKARAQAWVSAQQGIAPIILGTRLAAFTPLKNPGLFIIDEEHDLSFKQNDHCRYSARDLLLKRAQLSACPILLGSATPALESWHNARNGKYKHLRLPERAGDACTPQIEIVDTRHKKLSSGLSHALITQITEHLDKNNQVLLFLNRRGYAPVLICYECGWHQVCNRCDSKMIIHQNINKMRCHHCEAQHAIPQQCPGCGHANISALGIGTQRIEESLQDFFPQANIARVDRDSVRTKKQWAEVLTAIHNGTTNILIGTQMLAKGHHFPNISLVAILDIDAALFSADFRAMERIGQIITQVAGRAGRGTTAGKVILQTTHPEHDLLQTVIYDGYHAFLQKILHERQSSSLPPYTYQILIRAEAKKPNMAINFLQIIKQALSNNPNIIRQGPIPAVMEKRQGFFRAQLLLQANSRTILQHGLQSAMPTITANELARQVRWSVDVDPVDMF